MVTWTSVVPRMKRDFLLEKRFSLTGTTMVEVMHGSFLIRFAVLILGILTLLFVVTAPGACKPFMFKREKLCRSDSDLNISFWTGKLYGQLPIVIIALLLALIPYLTLCFDCSSLQLILDFFSAVILCVFGSVEV
ncbi:hypothetical protein L596_028821 [Steinernema carpocapsae]|uniref:Uncharacterized protein n=1 Tax=Steinernema carpocapsae TaxID=34508 RepID=A0A4U5LZL8_STECR|nr:hypothetical protein L596_028821 [Steinernema carpocapsae]